MTILAKIKCDNVNCHREFDLGKDPLNPDPAAVESEQEKAKDEGWTWHRGNDYCPSCSQKIDSNEHKYVKMFGVHSIQRLIVKELLAMSKPVSTLTLANGVRAESAVYYRVKTIRNALENIQDVLGDHVLVVSNPDDKMHLWELKRE